MKGGRMKKEKEEVNRLRPEDLEDGMLLKWAVTRFNADRTEQNLFKVFQLCATVSYGYPVMPF